MDELTQIANDLGIGRLVATFSESQMVSAEEHLLRNPTDLALRAKLLRSYTREMRPTEKLNHLIWFVKNIPDSRFCGESVFYLSPNEAGYADLAQVWLEQISQSDSLMRRVNACMFFEYANDDRLEEYFEQFFSEHRNNIWVQALSSPSDWFEEISREILNKTLIQKKKFPVEEKADAVLLREAANAAAHGMSELVYINQLDSFRQSQDLNALAFVIGYTAVRCQVDSRIGFQPDLTVSRFEAMCWTISNIASLPFAGSVFASLPFKNDWKVSPVIKLNDYLCDLWDKQLAANAENLQVIENAVNFVSSLNAAGLPVSDNLIATIQSSASGREALNRK